MPKNFLPGLKTLFIAEMFERISYYGMRALLILYLVSEIADGGLGLSDVTAAAIYGLFMSVASFLGLPGGIIGDRILGSKHAFITGALLIVTGNLTLAAGAFFGSKEISLVALGAIVTGIGILKPNVSALVHALYPGEHPQRDAGFAIYYMGINIGHLLGAALLPLIAYFFGWSAGFLSASIFMSIGLAYFVKKSDIIVNPERQISSLKNHNIIKSRCTILFILSIAIPASMILLPPFNARDIADFLTKAMVVIAIIYTVYLFSFVAKTATDRIKLLGLIPIIIGAAVFVIGLDQAGASLNLFAERFTDRSVGNMTIPSGSIQSVYAIGIIIFVPLFATLWPWLAYRGIEPSSAAKAGTGLLLLAASFLVMRQAAIQAEEHGTVLPIWLITTYLLHSLGDLHIGPVGLSAVSKSAPKGAVGQVLGLWFIALAIGHNVSGLISGTFNMNVALGMQEGFTNLTYLTALIGLVLLFLSPIMNRLEKTFNVSPKMKSYN